MHAAHMLVLAPVALLLASCSGVIFKQATLGGQGANEARLVSLDARQRAIISNSQLEGAQAVRRICAEPSPDVLTTLSAAVNAQAGANFGATASNSQANAVLGASVAEAGASLNRTQTVNMLRELMYRTCERYMNGAISEDELVVQAARDQRIMLGILAIEQLTSALTPMPVVLNGTARSGEDASSPPSSPAPATSAPASIPPLSSASSSASSTASTQAIQALQMDAPAIAALGNTIKDIALTIADTDEILLLCVRVIAKQEDNNKREGGDQQRILAQCFNYIEAKVASAAARTTLATEEALKSLEAARNQAGQPIIDFLFPNGVLDPTRQNCVAQAYEPKSQRPELLSSPALSVPTLQQLMGKLVVRRSLQAAVRQCQAGTAG